MTRVPLVLATTTLPSAITISTSSTWSTPSPCTPTSCPCPPPRLHPTCPMKSTAGDDTSRVTCVLTTPTLPACPLTTVLPLSLASWCAPGRPNLLVPQVKPAPSRRKPSSWPCLLCAASSTSAE